MDVDEISEKNLGIQPRWAPIGVACAYSMSTNISCAGLYSVLVRVGYQTGTHKLCSRGGTVDS